MKIDRKVFFFTFLFLVISICTTLAYNPTYYKPIYINNIGGSEQTYYQVLLNVTYDTGMQTDFDDLRVKYYNGDEWVFVPYWIEDKVDSEWCKLWFNASYIPANSWCNDTYRLYYGDPSATSASDGDATFEFFDDFEAGSFDSEWTSVGSAWSVQDTVVHQGNCAAYGVHQDSGRYLEKDLDSEKHAIRFWFRAPSATKRSYPVYLLDDAGNNLYFLIAYEDGHFKYYDTAYHDFPTPTTYEANTWYRIDVAWNFDTDKYDVWVDGSKISGDGITIYGSGTKITQMRVMVGSASQAGDIYLDNFIIRKYADPEPSALLGVEQNTCTAPTISSLTNSTPGTTSVTISWTTDQVTDNRVKYSKNSDLSNYSWSSWDNDTTSVSITLIGLYPNTVYYFQAWSYNSTYSDCYTTEPSSEPYKNFTTLNLSGIEPLYIDIEEVGEGYVKINASWIGFDAFETSHYFVFCGMSYGDIKSKKADGNGILTVQETLRGLFIEDEKYCCKAVVYRGNSSINPIYTDEACFIAVANETLKQTNYGKYIDDLTDISTELNVTLWASALSEPYKDRMGMTFFGIIFILPFIAMWIRGSNTIIPSILGMILGGFIWAYMPEKFVHMAYLFIIISIAGVIYGIFRQKI